MSADLRAAELAAAQAASLMLAGYSLGTGRGLFAYVILCAVGVAFGAARDVRRDRAGRPAGGDPS